MKATIGPAAAAKPAAVARPDTTADPVLAEAFGALIAAALGTQQSTSPVPAAEGKVAAATGKTGKDIGKAATPAGTAAVSVGTSASPAGTAAVSADRAGSGSAVALALQGPPAPPSSQRPPVERTGGGSVLPPAGSPAASVVAGSDYPSGPRPAAASHSAILDPTPVPAAAAPAARGHRAEPTNPPRPAAIAAIAVAPSHPTPRRSPAFDSTAVPVGTATSAGPIATVGASVAASPQPAPGSPVAQPVPDQLVRVLSAFRRTGDGEYTISMHLHPAELGDISVQVSIRDGVMSVALQAHDPGGHDVLEAALPDLHHQLGSDGMHVKDVSLMPLALPSAAQPALHADLQAGGQTGSQAGQQANLFGQASQDQQGHHGGNQNGPQLFQHGDQGSQFGGYDQHHGGQHHATTADPRSVAPDSPAQFRPPEARRSPARRAAKTTALDVDI